MEHKQATCKYCNATVFWHYSQNKKKWYLCNSTSKTDFHSKTCKNLKAKGQKGQKTSKPKSLKCAKCGVVVEFKEAQGREIDKEGNTHWRKDLAIFQCLTKAPTFIN